MVRGDHQVLEDFEGGADHWSTSGVESVSRGRDF